MKNKNNYTGLVTIDGRTFKYSFQNSQRVDAYAEFLELVANLERVLGARAVVLFGIA